MDGGLKDSGEAPGGGAEEGLAGAIDELAEILGLVPEEGRDADRGADAGSLASRIAALASRARELAAGERRARQAAASFRAASLALSRSPDSKALLEELLDYLNWIVAYDAAQVFLAGPAPSEGSLGAEAAPDPRAAREWRSGAKPPLSLEVRALAGRAGGRTLVEEREGGRLLYLPLRGPDGMLGEAVIAREGSRAMSEVIMLPA
jgi:hypothetical protein